jgi:DegV family protein with EDD domain
MKNNNLSQNQTLKPLIAIDSCCLKWESDDVFMIEVPFIGAAKKHLGIIKNNSAEQFYELLTQGDEFITSHINADIYYDFFCEMLKQERPIIYLAVSTLLSASYDSAKIAQKRIKKDFPQADLSIVDSRAIAGGQYLLLEGAVSLANNGHDAQTIVRWLNKRKLSVQHWLAVREIEHLLRSGRLPHKVKFMLNFAKMQLALKLDARGHIIPVLKKRQQKSLLKKMSRLMAREVINPEEQTALISYTVDIKDAKLLKEIISEIIPFREILIKRLPVVVGAHTGPHALLVNFWGKKRD